MSLGSDLLDAAKVCIREGFQQACILAGTEQFLEIVSPRDAGSLISFEKMRISVADYGGVISPPLIIGGLSASSTIPPDIQRALAELRRSK
jgi:hypothetical protein